MKAILYTFLPLVFFTFFTIVLFVLLKEDGTVSQKEPQIKELFDNSRVKKKAVRKKEKVVKKTREYFVPEDSVVGTLEVLDVRWHQHDGFERLVFDISADDNDVGVCKLEPDSDNTMYLKGELIGYRRFTPYLPTFETSQLIKSMEVVKNSDNNFVFTIKFYNPISYKAFALKDPARIVIDLY
jgi:hypothetical protein